MKRTINLALLFAFCLPSPGFTQVNTHAEQALQSDNNPGGQPGMLLDSQTATPAAVTIEVRKDERIQDFAARLEKANLTTVRALTRQAARTTPPCFPAQHSRLNPAYPLLRLEGLLVPGEYTLPVQPVTGIPGNATNRQLEHNARYILTELMQYSSARCQRLRTSHGLTPYEQMILASLVEKESVANQDYDLVASVFYNRLKHKINLASCPALEYALGFHRPFLIKEDILLQSPYNLYRKAGLPPTPICFFSDAALAAVTGPCTTAYLFFVYDWVEKKLFFARDYRKHMEHVRSARRHYLKKYGSKAIYKIFPELYYEPCPPACD